MRCAFYESAGSAFNTVSFDSGGRYFSAYCAAFTVFGAGIAHFLLMLFGGAPRPYETTLRVFCYGWSVGAINLVPICGVFIGAIWRFVVEIIGLRDAHPVPTGRAAAAVLLPVVLSCLCIILAFFVVGLAGLAGGAF